MSDLERWTRSQVLSVDITNYTCVVWLRTTTFGKMTHEGKGYFYGSQSCQHLKSRALAFRKFSGTPYIRPHGLAYSDKICSGNTGGEEHVSMSSVSPTSGILLPMPTRFGIDDQIWNHHICGGSLFPEVRKLEGAGPENPKNLCDLLHVHTAWEMATKLCTVKKTKAKFLQYRLSTTTATMAKIWRQECWGAIFFSWFQAFTNTTQTMWR